MLQRPGTPPGRGHLRPVPVTDPDQRGDVDRPAAFAVLAAGHAHPSERGAFGTPTLVLGAGHAAFVKLDAVPVPAVPAVPAVDRGRSLLERLRQLTVTQPALREYQRVTPTERS